jgi:hypothetical protein
LVADFSDKGSALFQPAASSVFNGQIDLEQQGLSGTVAGLDDLLRVRKQAMQQARTPDATHLVSEQARKSCISGWSSL